MRNRLPADEGRELKGSRWLWVTNAEHLSAEQRAELDRLERRFPDLAALHDHRERLRRVFEDGRVTRPATAVERLRAWAEQGRATGLTALDKFNRDAGELGWPASPTTSSPGRPTGGRAEGFNRGLRGLLWRACGMTNFAHFRLRVLHASG